MNLAKDYTKKRRPIEGNVTEVTGRGFGEESREPRCRNCLLCWDRNCPFCVYDYLPPCHCHLESLLVKLLWDFWVAAE